MGASFIFLSVHSNSNDGLLSVYSNPKAGTTQQAAIKDDRVNIMNSASLLN